MKEHEFGINGYASAVLLGYSPALFSAFLRGNLICLKDFLSCMNRHSGCARFTVGLTV
jgi:hypothetical protein